MNILSWSNDDTKLLSRHVQQHGARNWATAAAALGCHETLCVLKWHTLQLLYQQIPAPPNKSRRYSDWELCVLLVGYQASQAARMTKKETYEALAAWLPGRTAEGVKQAMNSHVIGQANEGKMAMKLRALKLPASLPELLSIWPDACKVQSRPLEEEQAAAADVLAALSSVPEAGRTSSGALRGAAMQALPAESSSTANLGSTTSNHSGDAATAAAARSGDTSNLSARTSALSHQQQHAAGGMLRWPGTSSKAGQLQLQLQRQLQQSHHKLQPAQLLKQGHVLKALQQYATAEQQHQQQQQLDQALARSSSSTDRSIAAAAATAAGAPQDDEDNPRPAKQQRWSPVADECSADALLTAHQQQQQLLMRQASAEQQWRTQQQAASAAAGTWLGLQQQQQASTAAYGAVAAATAAAQGGLKQEERHWQQQQQQQMPPTVGAIARAAGALQGPQGYFLSLLMEPETGCGGLGEPIESCSMSGVTEPQAQSSQQQQVQPHPQQPPPLSAGDGDGDDGVSGGGDGDDDEDVQLQQLLAFEAEQQQLLLRLPGRQQDSTAGAAADPVAALQAFEQQQQQPFLFQASQPSQQQVQQQQQQHAYALSFLPTTFREVPGLLLQPSSQQQPGRLPPPLVLPAAAPEAGPARAQRQATGLPLAASQPTLPPQVSSVAVSSARQQPLQQQRPGGLAHERQASRGMSPQQQQQQGLLPQANACL